MLVAFHFVKQTLVVASAGENWRLDLLYAWTSFDFILSTVYFVTWFGGWLCHYFPWKWQITVCDWHTGHHEELHFACNRLKTGLCQDWASVLFLTRDSQIHQHCSRRQLCKTFTFQLDGSNRCARFCCVRIKTSVEDAYFRCQEVMLSIFHCPRIPQQTSQVVGYWVYPLKIINLCPSFTLVNSHHGPRRTLTLHQLFVFLYLYSTSLTFMFCSLFWLENPMLLDVS